MSINSINFQWTFILIEVEKLAENLLLKCLMLNMKIHYKVS